MCHSSELVQLQENLSADAWDVGQIFRQVDFLLSCSVKIRQQCLQLFFIIFSLSSAIDRALNKYPMVREIEPEFLLVF